MNPPWITFNIFFFLLVNLNRTSGDEKSQEENENFTASRMQREISERERRLIPYMTYYFTQSITNPNSRTRPNIFIPITPPRENIFQFDAVPKIPGNSLQSVNLQHFAEALPKPANEIQTPLFFTTPGVQVGQPKPQYKPKSDGINVLPQIYRLEQDLVQSRMQTQVQPQQTQSETQSLQLIKVNHVPIERKVPAPQLIKIIPIITKLPQTDQSQKSLISQQPQYTYTTTKLQTIGPNAYPTNPQNIYKEFVTEPDENPFQRNKIYAPLISQETPQLRTLEKNQGPDKNKYTIAKIFVSNTTPFPYLTDVKFNVNDATRPKIVGNLGTVDVDQLRNIDSTSASYTQDSRINSVPNSPVEKYSTITPGQTRVHYHREDENQRQINLELSSVVQSSRQSPRLRVPEEENIRFVATVTPVPVTNDIGNAPQAVKYEENQSVKSDKVPLGNTLTILKETSNLPQNLTPENIDSGIKTLAFILERLQQQKNYQQTHSNNPTKNSDLSAAEPQRIAIKEQIEDPKKVHSFPQRSGTSTPGRPGIDYPTYSSIPQTNFDCSTQRYKGFFGDPDTKCQVWHYCDLNGGQASFLCPNGTIFSQVALTCDWWFNVKCASTSQLYVLNERLYKYILPFSPSFPEDYSGPIVDTYLTAKFKEMEAKSKTKALKSLTTTTTTSATIITTTTKPEITTVPSLEGETEAI